MHKKSRAEVIKVVERISKLLTNPINQTLKTPRKNISPNRRKARGKGHLHAWYIFIFCLGQERARHCCRPTTHWQITYETRHSQVFPQRRLRPTPPCQSLTKTIPFSLQKPQIQRAKSDETLCPKPAVGRYLRFCRFATVVGRRKIVCSRRSSNRPLRDPRLSYFACSRGKRPSTSKQGSDRRCCNGAALLKRDSGPHRDTSTKAQEEYHQLDHMPTCHFGFPLAQGRTMIRKTIPRFQGPLFPVTLPTCIGNDGFL